MSNLHVKPPPLRRFWETDWSLTTMLVLLVLFIFFLQPLHMIGYASQIVGGFAFTVMLGSGIVAVAETHSRRTTMILAAVALLSAAAHWARVFLFGAAWSEIDAISAIVVFGMLAGIVLSQVFREGPITSPRIQGAIAAFLLIALVFAALDNWIELHNPGAFAGALSPGEAVNPVQRFIYFSLVTLTTLGYGDITPVGAFARSMSTLEAFIGQIFPAILLARLVSLEVYYRQVTGDRGRAGRQGDH